MVEGEESSPCAVNARPSEFKSRRPTQLFCTGPSSNGRTPRPHRGDASSILAGSMGSSSSGRTPDRQSGNPGSIPGDSTHSFPWAARRAQAGLQNQLCRVRVPGCLQRRATMAGPWPGRKPVRALGLSVRFRRSPHLEGERGWAAHCLESRGSPRAWCSIRPPSAESCSNGKRSVR